jgi:DNA-binding NarL/FixJ family response regulator
MTNGTAAPASNRLTSASRPQRGASAGQLVTEPRSILLVDDHDLLRLGLKTLVQSGSASPAPTVFEARSLQGALDIYREHAASIRLVLLDLELPDARGLAGLQAFRSHFPEARVVVLSGSTDPLAMRKSLAAGAIRFLAKSGDLRQVIAYLRSEQLLADGDQAHEPEVDPVVNEETPVPTSAWTAAGVSVELTQRQIEVLEAVLAGHSNRQIAEATRLTEGTIKNHVSSLLLMFGVRSRAELISQLR